MRTIPWQTFSEAERVRMADAARDVLRAGGSLLPLARQFNVRRETLKINADPDFAAARRKRLNARRLSYRTNHTAEPRPPPEDAAARLAEIPHDTRTLSQRLMGDPMPGDLRRREAT